MSTSEDTVAYVEEGHVAEVEKSVAELLNQPPVKLTIDGKEAKGQPWAREREGQPFSTCALAFSESWTEAR